MEQLSLKVYAIFKILSLQIILILNLFSIFLYSQSNQTLKIEYKVKIPKTDDLYCKPKLAYNIDSIFVFDIGEEGCDSIIYQCINVKNDSVLWTVSGPEYGGTKFYQDSYYFVRLGVLFKNSISTGKVIWSIVIDTNYKYYFIDEINKNGVTLFKKSKEGSEICNEVFIVDLDGFLLNRQSLQKGEHYILLNQQKITNAFLCNIAFTPKSVNEISKSENENVFIKAFYPPIKYNRLYSINNVIDSLFFHICSHNYRTKITTDSIFSYCTSNGNLQLIYCNRRLSFDYSNHIYLGKGFLLYPQLDSIAYKEKKLKQTLLLINLRSNSSLWKFKIPEIDYNPSYIKEKELQNDSSFVYIIANKTLHVIQLENGNLLWKHKLKGNSFELFVSKEFLLVKSNKNHRKIELELINKRNPNQRIKKYGKYPILVDSETDFFYLTNKSNSHIYKARVLYHSD